MCNNNCRALKYYWSKYWPFHVHTYIHTYNNIHQLCGSGGHMISTRGHCAFVLLCAISQKQMRIVSFLFCFFCKSRFIPCVHPQSNTHKNCRPEAKLRHLTKILSKLYKSEIWIYLCIILSTKSTFISLLLAKLQQLATHVQFQPMKLQLKYRFWSHNILTHTEENQIFFFYYHLLFRVPSQQFV